MIARAKFGKQGMKSFLTIISYISIDYFLPGKISLNEVTSLINFLGVQCNSTTV